MDFSEPLAPLEGLARLAEARGETAPAAELLERVLHLWVRAVGEDQRSIATSRAELARLEALR